MRYVGVLRAFIALAAAACVTSAQTRYQPVRDSEPAPEIPYERWFTQDALGRRVTFYLGTEPDSDRPLPLVAFVLGSGAHSNFIERDGRILDGHRSLREVLAGRARLLIVEKPGVAFLSHPKKAGAAVGASEDFLREHTLERWSEAVSAAVTAALELPRFSPQPVLVAGHSEGSRTAFRVAARNPRVTHVAGLAGFTTSHLRCFLIDENWGAAEFGEFDDEDRRREAVVRRWRQILAERDRLDKLFAGHSYRYWASINAHTSLEFVLQSPAAVYLAQGTEDGPCAVEGFELLYAQLVERGREVRAARIEGADHGFGFRDDPGRNGWKEQMQRTLDWFFEPAARR